MEFMNREDILYTFEASGFESIVMSFHYKSGVQKKLIVTKEDIMDSYTGERIEVLINDIESEIVMEEFLHYYVEYLTVLLTNIENVGKETVIKIIHKDGLSNINLAEVIDVSVQNIREVKNHMIHLMVNYS